MEIKATPDGRAAIILRFPWAEILIAHLQAQAQAFADQLRLARNQEAIRQAELCAATGEARREQEEREAATYREYQRLVASGLAPRPALHRLKQAWTHLTVTDVAEIVRQGGVRERRRAREERYRHAQELRAKGVTTRAIMRRLKLSKYQVGYALGKKASGVPVPAAAVPDSPEGLVRLWADGPSPPEGADLAPSSGSRGEVAYPVSGMRKIRPEVELEIAEWVRWEVDRRSRRYGEDEEG